MDPRELVGEAFLTLVRGVWMALDASAMVVFQSFIVDFDSFVFDWCFLICFVRPSRVDVAYWMTQQAVVFVFVSFGVETAAAVLM